MKTFDKAIETIIGREPTADEMAKFYKVKELCDFSEHDSVWSILLAFGHYEILYEAIPAKIREQCVSVLAAHKDALDATAYSAERQIKSNLVESCSRVARDLSAKAIQEASKITIAKSRTFFVIGASLSFGLAALVISLVAYFSFQAGANTNPVNSNWETTKEGRTARQFSELNDIRSLMECDSSYQRKTEGSKVFCVPYDERNKKISGWRVK